MTSSRLPENTSSGLIDTGFVLRFEPLYDLSDLEAEIFDDIAPKVVRREGYKRKNFLKVVEWKAVAVPPTAEELSGDDIDYVTGVALDEDTPEPSAPALPQGPARGRQSARQRPAHRLRSEEVLDPRLPRRRGPPRPWSP